MGFTGSKNEKAITLKISQNHYFNDNTARDTYFSTHASEKVKGVLISVGVGYQEWNGTSWVDKTMVVTQKPFIVSDTAPTNTNAIWIKKL